MSIAADLFGASYLDVESFRGHVELFGAGMSLADYLDQSNSDAKLLRVLQAASRMVDAYCGRKFSSEAITETVGFDLATGRLFPSNTPVSSITACAIVLGPTTQVTIQMSKLFIDNDQGFIEIADRVSLGLVLQNTPSQILSPRALITYVSAATVPKEIKLATGYQAAYMINSGFVDKAVPPNFGKLDMGGMIINNRKGSIPAKDRLSGTMAPEAERILTPHIRFAVA